MDPVAANFDAIETGATVGLSSSVARERAFDLGGQATKGAWGMSWR
jgi:hypothetical protein